MRSLLCVLLLLSAQLGASAQFSAPVLPPPLPMHLYPVSNSGAGDAACGAEVNLTALALARQVAVAKYSALKEAASFAAFEAGIRALWDAEDGDVKVIVPAAGTYTGIEEVVEYITLVVGVVNDGYAYYYNTALEDSRYFLNNASISFVAKQKAKFWCRSPPSDGVEGDCQTEEMDALSRHHVSFKPCSPLIKQYVIAYDDMQNYMATKGARASTVCARHGRYCVGENRQYADFLDCMKHMEGMPFTSCGAEVFNGDNMLCRFKHSFMVRFRPDLHCPHIGKETDVCSDEDCDGDFGACTARPGDISYSGRLHPRCCKGKSRGGLSRCFPEVPGSLCGKD